MTTMIESTATDYSEFVDIALNKKLQTLNQSVNDILTRLEEFETMVLLIQQERCNSIGLTGSLTDCIDIQPQLLTLCQRIDTLENLIDYLKLHVSTLEDKLETVEEDLGINDNSNLFKNFLKSSLFKKQPDGKRANSTVKSPLEDLLIQKYFIMEEDN